jgi:hypothetical protein
MVCKKLYSPPLGIIARAEWVSSFDKPDMPAVFGEFQMEVIVSIRNCADIIEHSRRKEGVIHGT